MCLMQTAARSGCCRVSWLFPRTGTTFLSAITIRGIMFDLFTFSILVFLLYFADAHSYTLTINVCKERKKENWYYAVSTLRLKRLKRKKNHFTNHGF